MRDPFCAWLSLYSGGAGGERKRSHWPAKIRKVELNEPDRASWGPNWPFLLHGSRIATLTTSLAFVNRQWSMVNPHPSFFSSLLRFSRLPCFSFSLSIFSLASRKFYSIFLRLNQTSKHHYKVKPLSSSVLITFSYSAPPNILTLAWGSNSQLFLNLGQNTT